MAADLLPNDDEAVFHAMLYAEASKMANELKMKIAVIAEALGIRTSKRKKNTCTLKMMLAQS